MAVAGESIVVVVLGSWIQVLALLMQLILYGALTHFSIIIESPVVLVPFCLGFPSRPIDRVPISSTAEAFTNGRVKAWMKLPLDGILPFRNSCPCGTRAALGIDPPYGRSLVQYTSKLLYITRRKIGMQ